MKADVRQQLLEEFAKLAHDQWMSWSKAVSVEVSTGRRERWEKLWIPYDELSEKSKDDDRVWAARYLESCEDAGIKFEVAKPT